MAVEIKPIKNVLVPIDFSECSQAALRYALRIVEPCQARLHLLFVDDDPLLIQSTTDQSFRDTRHAEMSKQFSGLLTEQDLERFRVLQVIRAGTAYYEIEKYAAEESVDMIVIGNVGRTALANALLGSVATHVIREAPCAVLSVKADT